MKMRHWICAAVSPGGLLIGGVAAFSAYAASVEIENTKKQVSALEEEKKKVEGILSRLGGLKVDTAVYVKKLDGSLSSLTEELEQLGNRIALKEEEIDQAQIQLESARREEEHQYDSMKLCIKYMYENGQNNLLDMVMGSRNISELLDRAEYVSQIAGYDRKMLTAHVSAKEQAAAREQNLKREHGELLVLQESTQVKQASMQKLMDSKQKEPDSYNSKIAMAQDELDQHNADIKAQEEQVRRIEAEMKRREEEVRKKAEAAGKMYTVSNLGDISFRWPRPSSSRITPNSGDRESSIEGASSNHKRIDISASTGADIVAVADGEVVISTYNYSAGNYIMLDHGGGVSTVHMHRSKLLVGVGEKVIKGRVIAKVGSTGYSTGFHLHFGIRSGGIHVSPRGYVSPWSTIGQKERTDRRRKLENREFDRQEYNMGRQPDGPCRDNRPGPQDGNHNRAERGRFWTGVLVEVLVTALIGLIVVGISADIYILGKRVMSRQPSVAIEGKKPGITGGSGHKEGVDFDRVTIKMSMIQQIIDLHFLYDEDAGNVEDFTYRGMLAGPDDPYSMYCTEGDLCSISDSTRGTYSGIGVMLNRNRTTGLCTIAKVSEGSPVLEAGMQSGDIMYEVDGILVASESLDVLVNNYIKGEEGMDVAITVYRADKDEYVDMSVTRHKTEVPTMEYSMLDDKIGRIAVSESDMITAEQFEQAVDEPQKDGMEGLIIDLRSNPGRVLDSAVKMVDYILPDDLGRYKKGKGKTLIAYTADKNEESDVYTASDGYELKTPTAILVNGGSASASEVFTGVLKDYDQATVVGTISYRKGIVQDLIPPGDGSVTKITIAYHYTPNGLDLHGEGIEPNMEVELNEELKTQAVVRSEEDNQLQKAVQVLEENE